jgi:mitochondrial import receptor subunit TOM70
MSGGPSISTPPISATTSSSLWDRITDFASRNRKTIIYTTAAFTILFTAGGVYYYTQRNDKGSEGEAKRKREKKKKKPKQSPTDEESQEPIGRKLRGEIFVTLGERQTTVEDEAELPEISEEILKGLSLEVGSHRIPELTLF